LEAPRQCQGAARDSQGGPEGAKQESQRLLFWAPWGLPGEALGAAWETLRDHFEVKIDAKLHCVASKFFEMFFEVL